MAKVTLWINQLPFSTTERDLAAHFAEAAGVTADALLPHVRLLKKNGEFKGTAFLDVNGTTAFRAWSHTRAVSRRPMDSSAVSMCARQYRRRSLRR